MTFKEIIFQQFVAAINKQIEIIKTALADLKLSASNETKSTVGDKHETALAMLQIEQEMKRNQLLTLLQNKESLLKINPSLHHDSIKLGSLIRTNKGIFFMSIAMPPIKIKEEKIIAISPSSPLGSKIMGLSNGESISFNTVHYIINEVS